MSRRPIQGGFDQGARPDDPTDGVSADDFKDALADWASTVTVVAVRLEDGSRVLGTTATSFAPVAAEPPLVVVSLGATAQVLPELKEDVEYVVNLLARDQQRVASIHADSFPVGPSPFAEEGPPVVAGCMASLVCRVASVHPVEGRARLVVGRVERIVEGTGEEPLLYWRRGYTGIEGE